jgi:hypothetical protein
MGIFDPVPIGNTPELVQNMNGLIERMGFTLFKSTESVGHNKITVSELGYSKGDERIYVITNTAPREKSR